MIASGDGGHASNVHRFTRSRFARFVVTGKGVGGFSRHFLQRPSTKGAPLFLIGVDAIKAQLFYRLARGNAFHFSADLEPIFFDQLCSERRVVKYFKAQPVRRFERIPGKRASSLAATTYSLAACQLIGMSLDRREEELAGVTQSKKPPAVAKSAWLNR